MAATELDSPDAIGVKPLLLGYILAVSFAHEYGYWRLFHVQFLEHVGLSDLPKLALWPIFAVGGSTLVGMLIGRLTPLQSVFPEGGGADTREGKWLRKWRYLIGLVFSLLGVLPFYLLDNSDWFRFGPFSVAAGLYLLSDTDQFERIIGRKLSATTVVTALWIIFLAFGVGNHAAREIIDGREYLDARFDGLQDGSRRYVGRAGDFVFLPPASSYLSSQVFHLG